MENLCAHINYFVNNKNEANIFKHLIQDAKILESCVEGRLRKKETRIADDQYVDDNHDFPIKIISFDLFLNRVFQIIANNQLNINLEKCTLKSNAGEKQMIENDTLWCNLFQKFEKEYEHGCLQYMKVLNTDLKIKKDEFLTTLLTKNIQNRVDLNDLLNTVFKGMEKFSSEYEPAAHFNNGSESGSESGNESNDGNESGNESNDGSESGNEFNDGSESGNETNDGSKSRNKFNDGSKFGDNENIEEMVQTMSIETHPRIQNTNLSEIKSEKIKQLLNIGKQIAIDVFKLAHVFIQPPPNKIYDKLYSREFDQDDNVTEYYDLKSVDFKGSHILKHLREMDMSNTLLRAFEDLFSYLACKCFEIEVRSFSKEYYQIFQPNHGYKTTDSNNKIVLTAPSNNQESSYNFLSIKDDKNNTYVVDYVNGRSRGFDLTIWKYEEKYNTYFSDYGSIKIYPNDIHTSELNNRIRLFLNEKGQVRKDLASHPCSKIITPCVNKEYVVNNIDVSFKKKTTVIVGAGVAGLYAAYIMSKNFNDDVFVYERADRVGGLVQSKRCGGNTVVELGPSHHLESHTCMQNMLKFAGIKVRAFEPPSVIQIDDRPTTVQNLEDELFKNIDNRETFESQANKNGLLDMAMGLPWWDEMKHFCTNHYDKTTDDGQPYTVDSNDSVIGYQGALEKVATELKKRSVHIETNHEVKKEEIKKWLKDVNISRIIIATPPHVLPQLLSGEAPVSQAKDIIPKEYVIPRKSIRIYACFEIETELLSTIHEKLKNYHIVSKNALFRWAIAVSPQTFMISYTDADRAEAIEKLLKKNKEKGLAEVWESFKTHVTKHFLEKTDRFPDENPKFLVRDEYKGAAYHTVSECETNRDANPYFSVFPDFDPDKKISIVGEAYGPPKLRAWMEGACMSVKEVFKKGM